MKAGHLAVALALMAAGFSAQAEQFVGEWVHRDFPEFSIVIEKDGDKYKVTQQKIIPELTRKCVHTAVKAGDNKLNPVEKKAPCTITENNKTKKDDPTPLKYTTYVQKGDDILFDHSDDPEFDCAGTAPAEDDEYCTNVYRRAK